jgi:UDP-N-acetylmuramate dehydrogenase
MSDAHQRAFELLAARAHGSVKRDASLAPLTSYKLGGPAAILVEAATEADLEAVAAAAADTGLPVLVVGRGSNMLVSDRGYPGIALRLGAGFRAVGGEGDRVTAGAAVPLPGAATAALDRRLTGLEFAVAIPASVGGAVRMNAGAHGRTVGDVLESADVFLVSTSNSVQFAATALTFDYRRSSIPTDGIVVAATFALRPGDAEAISAGMREAREWRRASSTSRPVNQRTLPAGLPRICGGGASINRPAAAPAACSSTRREMPPDASSMKSAARGCGWAARASLRFMRTSSSPTQMRAQMRCSP